MLFSLTPAWNTYAQLPLPSQPLYKANTTKKTATPDARGTEQSPIAIKVIPPSVTDKKSAADNKERDGKSESDWWLVRLTGVLAIIGFLQLIVFGQQARRLRQTVTTMEDTADLARKEFISTHRPKIILRDATSEQDMEELIVMKYILANIGETPAKIVACALNVNVFKGWGFAPDNLPAVDSVDSDIDSIPLKPGEQVHLSFTSPTLRWRGDNDTCHAFIEPEYGMFFSGYIVYEDDARTRRHTGFRRKFFLDQHRFLPVDGRPHYEYQD